MILLKVQDHSAGSESRYLMAVRNLFLRKVGRMKKNSSLSTFKQQPSRSFSLQPKQRHLFSILNAIIARKNSPSLVSTKVTSPTFMRCPSIVTGVKRSKKVLSY